jgi:hypothetical protein
MRVLPGQYVTLQVARVDGRLQTRISYCDCISQIFFPHLAMLNAAGGMAASLAAIVLIAIAVLFIVSVIGIHAWGRLLGQGRRSSGSDPPS